MLYRNAMMKRLLIILAVIFLFSVNVHAEDLPSINSNDQINAEKELDNTNTAIEQALVSKGLTLLPAGKYRATPSASILHYGDYHYDEEITAITLEAGLPWEMAASISQTYLWKQSASMGNNQGYGDFTATLSKKLNTESDLLPLFVGRISVKPGTGQDPYSWPSIGQPQTSLAAGLSAVKHYDPLALYGNFSYIHGFEKYQSLSIKSTNRLVFQGMVHPGDIYDTEIGVTLAATPKISLDTSLAFFYLEETHYQSSHASSRMSDHNQLTGLVNIGVGVIVSKDLFFTFNAGAGITKHSPDFIFSTSMPYNF